MAAAWGALKRAAPPPPSRFPTPPIEPASRARLAAGVASWVVAPPPAQAARASGRVRPQAATSGQRHEVRERSTDGADGWVKGMARSSGRAGYGMARDSAVSLIRTGTLENSGVSWSRPRSYQRFEPQQYTSPSWVRPHSDDPSSTKGTCVDTCAGVTCLPLGVVSWPSPIEPPAAYPQQNAVPPSSRPQVVLSLGVILFHLWPPATGDGA